MNSTKRLLQEVDVKFDLFVELCKLIDIDEDVSMEAEIKNRTLLLTLRAGNSSIKHQFDLRELSARELCMLEHDVERMIQELREGH